MATSRQWMRITTPLKPSPSLATGLRRWGPPKVCSLAGARARRIDLRGRLLLPGFNDAHVHFLTGGFQLSGVDLRDASTHEEFSARIHRFAQNVPAGRWITGGDWDHERWPGAPLPTKEWIDAATTNTPV